MSYAATDRSGRDTSAADGAPPGIDAWALLGRVWARRGFLLLVILCGMTLAYVALMSVTPRYTGEVRILIEGRTADPTTPLSSQNVVEADQQKIESEIQVLLSRTLAERVVEKLELETWGEFKEDTRGGLFGPLMELLGLRTAAPSSKAAVIDAYFERLNVYQVGTSRVIALDFWAEHPRTAMVVANAIADIYVAGQLDQQVAVTRRASSWLDQQVEQLRERVAQSERKVEDFRQESGLIEANGNLLKSEELSELNTQLILASAARAEAQARLEGARELLSSPSGIESSAEVLSSPLIQQLREQEVQLRRRMTELSADLLPQHPDMVALRAELEDLKSAIAAEVDKIVRKLKNEVQVAAARERELRRSIERLKAEVGKARQREGELRALEREAAANRSLLENFLVRASEADARGGRPVQRPEARIISRAETPESPSFPQKGPMLFLAFLASTTIGLLLILAIEVFSGGAAPAPVYAGRSREPRLPPAFAAPASYQPQTASYQPAYPQSYPQQHGGYAHPANGQQSYGQGGFGQQGYQPSPAFHAPAPRMPVTQVVARLPGSGSMTHHDHWLLGAATQEIARFITSRPSVHNPRVQGRVVRVAGGRVTGEDVVALTRLLASQGMSVVAIGAGVQRNDIGLTDVIARRAGFEHVVRPDSQTRAAYIGWGTIPVDADPRLVRQALEALAGVYQIVLVGETEGAARGMEAALDWAADTALVFDRGRGTASHLPSTDTAGIIQIS